MNFEAKAAVTRKHFTEIDASDVLYAFVPMGYAGISVVEMSYAFAKGKRVVVSEPCSRCNLVLDLRSLSYILLVLPA